MSSRTGQTRLTAIINYGVMDAVAEWPIFYCETRAGLSAGDDATVLGLCIRVGALAVDHAA
jgi:hypothetical protein